MDGVLCDDEPSRMAGIDLFPEIGAEVTAEHLHLLLELTNILGGVAPLKGVEGFDTEVAKKRLKYISKRIVIEDSLAGVQAAKAAQMSCDNIITRRNKLGVLLSRRRYQISQFKTFLVVVVFLVVIVCNGHICSLFTSITLLHPSIVACWKIDIAVILKKD
ncbi:uncharacterized protein LOC113271740 [Papaver somniferum]|uniref:uncharacterized protein LOC113271740 n=1 Tax=Papaver somniferum TaxID=3469 RepID=UPI000E704567|nr:uncharacterized protein LOC113271740 [Papaver somniferum]